MSTLTAGSFDSCFGSGAWTIELASPTDCGIDELEWLDAAREAGLDGKSIISHSAGYDCSTNADFDVIVKSFDGGGGDLEWSLCLDEAVDAPYVSGVVPFRLAEFIEADASALDGPGVLDAVVRDVLDACWRRGGLSDTDVDADEIERALVELAASVRAIAEGRAGQ